MSNGTSNIVDDVLFHNKNLARVISLNRPGKLNSLNTSMVSKIYPRLVEYAKSDINNMIILDSTSPKGLCAGGDVAEAAKEILNDNSDYAVNFFKGEYNLNFLIGTYPKPFIALMDGITMGGGVGLSVHAPFRISTDTTKLAMPEMDIGFFPDVGTTFFLPRVDDKVGYYVALTGTVLSGLDAYMLGFATHYVPRDRLGSLVNRLSNLQPPNQTNLSVSNQKEYYQQINDIINEFTDTKLPKDYNYPFSTEQLIVIKEAFSQPTFDDVLKYLVDSSSQFAKETLEKLLAKSPTSLRVGFELMNQGAKNSLRKQLELELITAANIMTLNPEINDFVKGVKHKLIDKIKEPSLPEWSPVTDAVKLMTSSIEVGKLEKPLIHSVFNIDYVHYPYNFGVPKNNQIKSFINGTDTKRSYLPTVKEVYSHFKSDKLGTELKLQSTLELHGDLQKYQSKYVSWVE
ncbi:3-hydroxyisobutyryl-CoA hydrolase [Yamadazyma tenuis]|uniref:3-hydroxyisobutyryl-CoA hydrolase n=1 Tax=Candida tenuis (strain ATCC 10573 / BCRC 21748 / CBS 615 / JCM 9827 / NBRC 10315 / NRRL Y-1498 / VKM Y-70) TaxID=590646 RepID=G3BDH1_CANTC|nr:uncharacterized protein CANTEDRAFT_116348 [Yamadazyma tenuis ATCC 10573]XP_006690296.1 mitochondrial enoyl-CoA hydratase [Yamadazyma tenuis ATCC 10573]EGV61081.1 hypothetical protein CANTEDRAFT_116348 [Yamadazyma tenuis ATCC 10573]EGV61082.1 mitochondrial enoyl-CoA hydratase [Yamadazyma tenuis ATCC 10573]WEJ94463.1 3-hydroxyisobutyryl-CoA hydrolase [Yamadazyma tenuis]